MGKEKDSTCTITSRSTIPLATWPPLSKRLRKTARQLSDEIANRNVLRGQWKESRSTSSITSLAVKPGIAICICMYVNEDEQEERNSRNALLVRGIKHSHKSGFEISQNHSILTTKLSVFELLFHFDSSFCLSLYSIYITHGDTCIAIDVSGTRSRITYRIKDKENEEDGEVLRCLFFFFVR